jgi:hypothetical protein
MEGVKMNTLAKLTFALFCLGAHQAFAEDIGCDQKVYDKLYRNIVVTTVQKMTPDEFKDRNRSIRALRDLCRGQKSSYEKAYPWDVVGM